MKNPMYKFMRNMKYKSNMTVCVLAATILSIANLCASYRGLPREQELKMREAREALTSQGDEAIPLLLRFFEEDEDRYFRIMLLNAILYDKTISNESMKKTSDFLGKHIESFDMGQLHFRHSDTWIIPAIKVLAKADPEQARRISWKALDEAPESYSHTQAALVALGDVGTMEDAERLQEWIVQKNTDVFKVEEAERSIGQIKLRTARPQDYKDIKAMLDTLNAPHMRPKGSQYVSMISPELLDARESFRAKGDNPAQVLLFLYEQDADVESRLFLADGLSSGVGTPESKKMAADFFAERFFGPNAQQQHGGPFRYLAMRAIAKNDPEQARRVARKYLSTRNFPVDEIKILEEIGTDEDMELLNTLVIPRGQRKDEKKFGSDDKSEEAREHGMKSTLSNCAERAIEQIQQRTKGKKGKPDDEK